MKIFPIQQKGTAPVATEPYYLLLLNHYPLLWENREITGLYAGNLGMDSALLSPVKQIKQGMWEDDTGGSSGQYWYYGIIPNSGCVSADGSYFVIGLSQLQPPNDAWYYDALAISCKPDGSLINVAMLDTKSAYASSINGLPKNNYFASWQLTTSKATTYYNRKLNKTLKAIGPGKVALKKKNILFSCVVNLGIDPGLYQISATAAPGASVPMYRNRLIGPAGLSPTGTYSLPSTPSVSNASPGRRARAGGDRLLNYLWLLHQAERESFRRSDEAVPAWRRDPGVDGCRPTGRQCRLRRLVRWQNRREVYSPRLHLQRQVARRAAKF